MKVQRLVIVFFILALTGAGSAIGQKQVKYLERRSSQSIIGNKFYSYEFTDQDIPQTPSWDARKKEPPPILLNQALDITGKYLQQRFADADKWTVETIHLDLIGKSKWIYEIAYACPTNVCGEERFLRIVMKMDGKIIEHKISDKKFW